MTRQKGVFPTFTAVALMAAFATGPGAAATKSDRQIERAVFGHTAGKEVDIFTLTNAHGLEVRIMTYGAAIVSLKTPDRVGHMDDIVLGFDTLEPYLAGVPYFGAIVGRYANRIAKGRLTVDGKTYQLPVNDGPNSLHGGPKGFDKQVWTAEPGNTPQGPELRLTYVSAEGEAGYPGQLTAHVVYQLRNDNVLSIDMTATSTAATPVNLANHAYFNLSGDRDKPIVDHVLKINAETFTPIDATLIPTGELPAVTGTPFDFRTPTAIGARINADDPQLKLAGGYDHNWVLEKPKSGGMTTAAILSDPASGRVLELRTTQPGLQFYSGNFLDGRPPGIGTFFKYRTGLCLETQHFPDSPNHPDFPSTILRSGETYHQHTDLVFRTEK